MRMLMLALCFSLAQKTLAKNSLENTGWKIDSYKMDGDYGAWSDDEAQPLINKKLKFESKGITLGEKFCKGTLEDIAVGELTSNLKVSFCGKTIDSKMLVSIDLDCNEKIRFTPYAVKLSNGKYLAFGDGIAFCLSELK